MCRAQHRTDRDREVRGRREIGYTPLLVADCAGVPALDQGESARLLRKREGLQEIGKAETADPALQVKIVFFVRFHRSTTKALRPQPPGGTRINGRLAHNLEAKAPCLHLSTVDGRRETTGTAVDHRLPEEHIQVMTRRLNDGREFKIVKNFYEPVSLAARFASFGFDMAVRETATYFLYGYGTQRKTLE